MTLNQFVSNEVNRFVDVDGAYGAQCWDIVELYAEQVLGVPREPWAITLGSHQSAYEAWTVFDSHMQKYFSRIPAGQEQRGDIIVYGPLPGDSAGHIDICLGGGQVEEQNAPYGSPVAIHSRTDYDVLGSLRFKGGNMIENEQQNDLIFLVGVSRHAEPQEVGRYVGKTYDYALSDVLKNADRLAQDHILQNLPDAQKKLDQIKAIVE